MSLAALLQWIQTTDLKGVDPELVRPLIAAARAELAEDDPRDERLYDIDIALWEGSLPVAPLLAFYAEFGGLSESDDVQRVSGAELDKQYRQLAAALPVSQWHTDFYDEALLAVDLAEAQQSRPFRALVAKLRDRLVGAWEPYTRTPLVEKEVTAETVVGHHLLREGVEGWLEALDQLLRAERNELTFDQALATGERANRLLVATQKLAQQVADEARDLSAKRGG